MNTDKFKKILGSGGYIDNPQEMAAYVEPWRAGKKGKTPLIALPSSTLQVVEIIKICAKEKIAVVPQGGNTGLVAGSTPSQKGDEIVINLSRMNKIREISKEGFFLTAEAGCILEKIQEEAEANNLLFPLSMGSEGSCEVGGFVSTNAGGSSVLRYGNTRDLVLGLEVVLPDGTIWNGLRFLRKDNTGYDMKQLFIGAEGTLGIITAATFRLFPLPKQTVTSFIAISDIAEINKLFLAIKNEIGENISAFEFMSKETLQLVLKHINGSRNPFEELHLYYILAEFSSSYEQDDLKEKIEVLLSKYLESDEIKNVVIADSLSSAESLWKLRDSSSEAVKKEGNGLYFDICVPINLVADFIENTNKEITKYFDKAKIIAFGHGGDGNIHYDMNLPVEVDENTKNKIKEIVYDSCLSMGGSISAEHGIGVLRKYEFNKYKPAIEVNLMKKIKRAFDPDNIMNPGKLL